MPLLGLRPVCQRARQGQSIDHGKGHQLTGIGAIGQVNQVGPKMIDQVLLGQQEIGWGVVKQVAQPTGTARVDQLPV